MSDPTAPLELGSCSGHRRRANRGPLRVMHYGSAAPAWAPTGITFTPAAALSEHPASGLQALAHRHCGQLLTL